MKKISLIAAAMLCFLSFTFAQNDKYVGTMKTNIAKVENIMRDQNGAELANTFGRIGDAEKNQWLPFYYAAYCTIVQAYTDDKNKDAIADKATELLDKAESILGKKNSEIEVVRSMIANAHMMVDPQSRYMTYGPASAEHLSTAKTLDPTNPRPVLLEAEGKFHTPEQYGGGKEIAKEYFDKANELFEKFQPETELSPSWGKGEVVYFLSQYK